MLWRRSLFYQSMDACCSADRAVVDLGSGGKVSSLDSAQADALCTLLRQQHAECTELRLTKVKLSDDAAAAIGNAVVGTQIQTIVLGPKSTKVQLDGATRWDLSAQDLGAAELMLLAELLKSPKVNAAISSFTCSSTGNPRQPKTYTITEGTVEANLANLNLGPQDMMVISALLKSPKLNAAITSLLIGHHARVTDRYCFSPYS